MEYLASQQRAQWVFTPESLSAAREQSRMNAAKAAATAREEEARLRGEAGAAVGEDGGEGGGEGAGLTVAEEGVLLRQSQVQMQETAERMGIPAHVTAVALSLFKCFYVRHAVSDHLPWQIMPACLMAAVKAEECPMFQAERTPFSVDKFLRAMDAAHNQSAQGQAKR